MSVQLVIAEKPSVARSIAAVIGATEKQNGYWQGGGYLVSWCIGHLVSFAEAGQYDEKYCKWKYEAAGLSCTSAASLFSVREAVLDSKLSLCCVFCLSLLCILVGSKCHVLCLIASCFLYFFCSFLCNVCGSFILEIHFCRRYRHDGCCCNQGCHRTG